MFLITSGWMPGCFLVAFDIGKSDLPLLPCRIFIGDYKLPVRAVCDNHKTLLEIFAFFYSFEKQALYYLYILLYKSI